MRKMASKVLVLLTALAGLATVRSQTIALPDGTCTRDNTRCQTLFDNSHCFVYDVCSYGTSCQCDEGYSDYSFYNATALAVEYSCRPATALVGDRCEEHLGVACSGLKTTCYYQNDTYSECRCTGNYQPNADRSDCVPENVGQSCVNRECGVNAYCDSTERCRCKPGYKLLDNSAVDCTHYNLGEPCSDTTECEFTDPGLSCGYGTCKSGTFQCMPGTIGWKFVQSSELIIEDIDCLRDEVQLVGNMSVCDSSNNICRSGQCVTCPEYGVSICNGALSINQIPLASFLLLLACYLFH